MKPLITPSSMRNMEMRYFEETGTPSIEVMERAAQALCEAIVRNYGVGNRILFACGPGGNGGDGYACARLYAERGGSCAVVPAYPPSAPDAIENAERARKAGVEFIDPDSEFDAPEIWVDALYGTGLSRAPEGTGADLIRRMNADYANGSMIIAVDIPSGLSGASGSAYNPCIRADMTVTFQFAKCGHYLGDGLDLCGEIVVADIGIPLAFCPDDIAGHIEEDDIRAALPSRPRNIHKGNCGHLLIVAGSVGMAGAAALCAQAALRSGAGLVTIACPDSIVPVLQTLAPCAMCVPLPERNGAIAPEAVYPLKEALSGKTAVVCGCGLSRKASPEILKLLLTCPIPVLFDADALNIISSENLRELLCSRHLITPHPGEAARLLGHPVTDPVSDARALRAMGPHVLLKGASCTIADEECLYISASGCCGMARGGSGDVLSGIIGALMAEPTRRSLGKTAAIASEIHGLAGELAQEAHGTRGMCSQDIVTALPEVFKQYE
ncbi:MAG: NAD(P)H-hydrate dehydratase [Clostridia bacterium]|nr:NAD(P)H-hydrate dehydratase [Clostridia bacterium]